MNYNFAITGVAGYIAPRHLRAIKDTGNTLVAALDPHDAAGVLDSYFPQADFFTEPERFDRHLEKLRRSSSGQQVDYLSICSPNYLHDAHIRMALRTGAHAICEKPLVLNPHNLKLLQEIEAESGKKVYNVLQLRHHPAIKALKEKHQHTSGNQIELTYITGRGKWYDYSWKGQPDRSGGIASNIGIHFFDMLIWIFGAVEHYEIHLSQAKTMSGYLKLERAEIRWFLSIDDQYIPQEIKINGQRTYRSILVNRENVEFSNGFTDLHTEVYRDILSGGGFGIEAAGPSVHLAHAYRNAEVIRNSNLFHSILLR